MLANEKTVILQTMNNVTAIKYTQHTDRIKSSVTVQLRTKTPDLNDSEYGVTVGSNISEKATPIRFFCFSVYRKWYDEQKLPSEVVLQPKTPY